MKKLLLSLATALLTVSSALAGSYTIEFTAPANATETNPIAVTKMENWIVDYDTANTNNNYVSKAESNGKVYNGTAAKGIRIGSGSNGGSFTLTLNEIGKVKPTSIVISAMQYKNTETNTLKVNGSDAQTPDKTELKDLTYSLSGTTEITEIKLESSERVYVKSITVNYGANEPVKQPAGIEFASEDFTMTFGEAAPLFKNPNTLDVVFTSTNDKVAYVENGEVRVVMPGKATITATTEGNDDFEAGEAVLNLTVRTKAEASAPEVFTNDYTKVTADNQIAAGNQYIIVSTPNKSGKIQYGPMALSTAKSNNKGFDGAYLSEEAATTIDERYTVTDEFVTIFTLEPNESDNTWFLKSGEQYLDASKEKELKLSDTQSAFSISASADKTDIKNGSTSLKVLYANGSGGTRGSITFNNYNNSTSKPVFLYVREKGVSALAIPTIVANFHEEEDQGSISYSADGEGNWLVFITKNGSIELKAADENHSVFYSMENQTVAVTPSEQLKVAPKDGFQAYETPIQFGDKQAGNKYLIKFYAADENGVESPVESLVVDYTGSTGVEAIEADGEAVYFDLQGNRVAEPENGVYIMVKGGKAVKVLF